MNKLKKILLLFFITFKLTSVEAQNKTLFTTSNQAFYGNTNTKNTVVKSDLEQVTEILLDYIEAIANGQPERLRKAFHPNFNVYTVAKDTLWIRSGKQYISSTKVGEKSNRIGRIISIDIEKDGAMAKAEIEIPNWGTFTDYFLILKYQGVWKIAHKELPKREKK